MPWTPASFKKHNKDAVGRLGVIAAHVANQVLEKTGDEGRAVREANAVIARAKHPHQKPRK